MHRFIYNPHRCLHPPLCHSPAAWAYLLTFGTAHHHMLPRTLAMSPGWMGSVGLQYRFCGKTQKSICICVLKRKKNKNILDFSKWMAPVFVGFSDSLVIHKSSPLLLFQLCNRKQHTSLPSFGNSKTVTYTWLFLWYSSHLNLQVDGKGPSGM